MKSNRTILAVMLVVVSALFSTSCKKSDLVDISDSDQVGKFEITMDGKKYTGTEVFSGAVMAIRTINAKALPFEFNLLCDNTNFSGGGLYKLGQGDATIVTISLGVNNDGQEILYYGLEGSVKIISDSKIEINGSFYSDMLATNVAHKVTGSVSSK